ncbi:MAG TPA: glycosyltransferase [Chitinophagaceae bacterium]|nr:glycosyltransferase [Chitinophagaceae bacterium]
MDSPLLTVLMPVYNADRFLAEAIDSILAQTFTQFEFLIIDDASSDNSVSIIKSYNDPRIRLVRNDTNLGITASLNKGISLSKSEWIARMDADDISYPQRLERQYKFCLEHPDCALVSCWVQVVSEDLQPLRTERFKSPYYYYNLTFECWIYHPSVVYRRSAAMDVGMYTVPYAEDYELFWQLSRKYKIYNLPEVLMDYRVTATSLHQVTRKNEYAAAQTGQVVRNIEYYAGRNLTLSNAQLECLRHNFKPILEENSLKSMISCIRKLDLITRGILEKENINNDPGAIKEAAYHKRAFILSNLAKKLPGIKAIWLLIRLKAWGVLKRSILNIEH